MWCATLMELPEVRRGGERSSHGHAGPHVVVSSAEDEACIHFLA